MKLNELLEQSQIDELAFTRTGKAINAAKRSVKDDVNKLERFVLSKMAGAGDKTITIGELSKYLDSTRFKGIDVSMIAKGIEMKKIMNPTDRDDDSLYGKAANVANKVKNAVSSNSPRAKADAGLESVQENIDSSKPIDRSQLKALLTKIVQYDFKHNPKKAKQSDTSKNNSSNSSNNDDARLRKAASVLARNGITGVRVVSA